MTDDDIDDRVAYYDQLFKEAPPAEPLPPISDRLPRGYVSVSQLNQYLKCPKAYEFRYLDEIEVPRNSYMVQGSAIHRAGEVLHKAMLESMTIPDVTLTLDAYATAHREMFTPDVIIAEEDKDLGHILDTGVKMVSVYHQGATGLLKDENKEPIPPVYPVAVERKLITALKPMDRDPYPFMAIIDLEEPTVVVDLKTKRKKGSQAEVENSLQLSLYSAATGKPDVRLDQLIKPTKTLPTRYIRLSATRTEQEIAHAVELGADIVDGITAGYFPRSSPDAWWCTAEWCHYWGLCRGKKA